MVTALFACYCSALCRLHGCILYSSGDSKQMTEFELSSLSLGFVVLVAGNRGCYFYYAIGVTDGQLSASFGALS